MSTMRRRSFVNLLVPATFALTSGGSRGAFAIQSPNAVVVPKRPPRLAPEMAEEFVRVAHGNLTRVEEMLQSEPGLLNATWDWGGGDWETGLGGASHMGNKAIAEYLLSKGARMDIFCAATLGKIDIVRAMLDQYPDAANLKGPHGIPLIRHAIAGKQEELVAFLKTRGAAAA